jgi:predicted GNAT family acetyltransferase
MADPVVRDDQGDGRFVIEEGGHEAELVYEVDGDRIVLIHTGVPDELGGRGLGGVLVKAALARAEAEGLTVVPRCPFARSWLEKHPDEIGAVSIDWPS